MDVSVIIVNYKMRDITLQCLRSLFQNTSGVEMEVIVVDNASGDATPQYIHQEFPQVRVIESNENLGFGGGNNLGNSYATGKYLFFLNSDTIVIRNIAYCFFDFMEKHPEYASCGGNLLDRYGTNAVSHGKFPSLLQEFSDIGFSIFYRKFYRNKLALGQCIYSGDYRNVDYISGADIFIRKEIFDSMDGFDKNIFMYYEETDLYFRMYKKGLKSCLLPYAIMVHLEGGSFSNYKEMNLKRFWLNSKSKFYFYKKNYGTWQMNAMRILNILSILTHSYKNFGDSLKCILLLIKY